MWVGLCALGGYEAVMEHIKSTVEPVEFVGKAGDVLFLHPTM